SNSSTEKPMLLVDDGVPPLLKLFPLTLPRRTDWIVPATFPALVAVSGALSVTPPFAPSTDTVSGLPELWKISTEYQRFGSTVMAGIDVPAAVKVNWPAPRS